MPGHVLLKKLTFWLVCEAAIRYTGGGPMKGFLPASPLVSSPIIQILSAFNCRFLGPNTR